MHEDLSRQILSDITVHMKYARYLPEKQRRETWEEIVTRNMNMHIKEYPQIESEIREAYDFVYDKRVLPSMRSMQFAGEAIEKNPARIFNCSYLPIEDTTSFAEIMFLLLGGTGVGYSVQRHHVSKLPPIRGVVRPQGRQRKRRYLVGDSIEGWADAVKVLVESWFEGKREVEFDFRDIRPKGALLITSGGKAPGPAPLREALARITGVFENALSERGHGTKLLPTEAHHIVCMIADCVLAGGIRRAALISLFSFDDLEMATAKSGAWWEKHPYLARANNSAVVDRSRIKENEFWDFWKKIQTSGSGEPGFFFTNDSTGEWGGNPCLEVSLRPYQFCNLTEINASTVTSQEDLNQRAKAAALIGTLQAGYVNFHYLRPEWRDITEKEALLGVSMTGVASGAVDELDLTEAADVVKEENDRVSSLIGINPSARLTSLKPAGTTSLVLGTSSGIHSYHAPYYIRRIRVQKNEAIYGYLKSTNPELIEDDVTSPDRTAVISIPQKAPVNAVTREESPFNLLERIKRIALEWIAPGHRKGVNRHNVSATVSVKDGEWEDIGKWVWENRDSINGITFLPYFDANYEQMPFEEITEGQYKSMADLLHKVDLTQVTEEQDNTELVGELACAGGACEVTGSAAVEKDVSLPIVALKV